MRPFSGHQTLEFVPSVPLKISASEKRGIEMKYGEEMGYIVLAWRKKYLRTAPELSRNFEF